MIIKQLLRVGIFYKLLILSGSLQASDKLQPYLIGHGMSDTASYFSSLSL
jgi:hypothetical protein